MVPLILARAEKREGRERDGGKDKERGEDREGERERKREKIEKGERLAFSIYFNTTLDSEYVYLFIYLFMCKRHQGSEI